MNRYFKSPASRHTLGEGTIWVEFEGEYPTRQAERFGDKWFSSAADRFRITDQPLSNMDPEIWEDEISREEFEAAWEEALRQLSGGGQSP